MTTRSNSFRHNLGMLAIFVLVPGISAFLLAQSRMNSEIQPAKSGNLDGLEISTATIDIGTVWSGGQNVQREFTLTNRTGHQISIESVASDCGCTVPTIVSSKIENGQATKILVVFSPPAVANDRGIEFSRTISVVVDTVKGKEAFHLFLTGLVEPDQSLRVFPVNVELDGSAMDASDGGTILHFKGSLSILKSIPNKLTISPGHDQRVLIRLPPAGRLDAVGTKDVKVTTTGNATFTDVGTWKSAVTFAPDSLSDGLTIHLTGHAPRLVSANPASLILTDSDVGSETTVRLTSKRGTVPVPDYAKTDLPLALDFPDQKSYGTNFRTLRIRVKGPLLADSTGTIQVQLTPQGSPTETLSIPVILLREQKASVNNFNHACLLRRPLSCVALTY
jgi:hypothetical protein